MSWVPPSSAGIYDPQSRTAPRPAAAAPPFTFGRYEERQHPGSPGAGAAAAEQPGGVSQRPERANYDVPVEQLRWWQQPRSAATVSGTRNRDVEAFWKQASQDPAAVEALVGAQSRRTNKAQGLGSSIAASLGDHEQFTLAQAQSLYKSDMTAGHVRVGQRGVKLSEEAMQAYEESRKQAERNKAVGRATNMKLALF